MTSMSNAALASLGKSREHDPNEPTQSLRQASCAACRRIFNVCRPHDRGQMYCSQPCRKKARQRVCRAARARHQATDEGRRDHRDRQRAYRRRQAALKSVTDPGSHATHGADTLSECFSVQVAVSRAKQVAPHPVKSTMPVGTLKCCLCNRSSHWVHFSPSASRHPPRKRKRLKTPRSRHFTTEIRGR